MAHMTMEFATSAVLSTAVRRRMDPAAYDHKPHRARARYVRRFGGDASATDEEVAAAADYRGVRRTTSRCGPHGDSPRRAIALRRLLRGRRRAPSWRATRNVRR